MRRFFNSFLISVLALGLIGCRALWDPTFMPAGYTYHHEIYKSPPGPEGDEEPEHVVYALEDEDDYEEENEAWRSAASDLLDQMERNSDITSQNVYMKEAPSYSAFGVNYDRALRDEFSARGYVFQSEPSDLISLHYEGYTLETSEEEEEDSGFKNFMLKLSAVQDNTLLAQVSGTYKLPVEED